MQTGERQGSPVYNLQRLKIKWQEIFKNECMLSDALTIIQYIYMYCTIWTKENNTKIASQEYLKLSFFLTL